MIERPDEAVDESQFGIFRYLRRKPSSPEAGAARSSKTNWYHHPIAAAACRLFGSAQRGRKRRWLTHSAIFRRGRCPMDPPTNSAFSVEVAAARGGSFRIARDVRRQRRARGETPAQ